MQTAILDISDIHVPNIKPCVYLGNLQYAQHKKVDWFI